jgi:SAM-dependent methyltransferase
MSQPHDTATRLAEALWSTPGVGTLALPFDRQMHEALVRAFHDLACPEIQTNYLDALDVGCGKGELMAELRCRVVGVEPVRSAYEEACKAMPNATIHHGPIETFRSYSDTFDLVLARETIEHWGDVDAGLDAIRECIKLGGVFVVSTPNRDSLHVRMGRKLGVEVPLMCQYHVREFGFRELIDLVKRHGFVLAQSAGALLLPFWAYEKVIGNRLRHLTDNDEEVNRWLHDIGKFCPAEYAFHQIHRFVAV